MSQCQIVKSHVGVRFHQLKTIKGIAIRSNADVDIKFDYAIRQPDPWILVGKSVRDKPNERRVSTVCDKFNRPKQFNKKHEIQPLQ